MLKVKFLSLLLLLSGFSGLLSAQMGPPAKPGTWSQSLRASYVYQDQAELDSGGGEFGFQYFNFAYDLDYALPNAGLIGANVGWSGLNSDFSTPVAPWEDVSLFDFGLTYRQALSKEWILQFTPSIQFARESGAEWNDSLRYGGLLAAARVFNPDLILGFGVAGFSGLEDSTFFPVIFVKWEFAQNWTLANPFRPGPTGPAGLEIIYSGLGNWEFAFGGGYRSIRFRLDEANPTPEGFGEVTTIPVFLRASHPISDGARIDFFVGASVRSEVTLDDRDDNRLGSDDVDPGLLAGLSASLDW